ncbi:MAG: class I SAM-dependent methyltransferase [Hylemonella sp.]
MFSSRIDVEHYDAYELLHPAYARQTVAMAQDIDEFAPKGGRLQAIDVGTGPGLPLLMLKELLPDLQALAVEPDPAAYGCLAHNVRLHRGIELHQGDFLSIDLPPASVPLVTSTGASHRFNTAFMLQKAMALLQPGGVLTVADEFLPAFRSAPERQAALVRHHGAYLVAAMACLGPSWPLRDDAEGHLYGEVRRTLTDALLWVDEGRLAHAVGSCRNLASRLQAVASPSAPGDLQGAVLRFFRLEWQAMVAGFDYEVERRTHPAHFLALARMAGFTLLRHRRLFATTGHDDMGGGTHLFTFAKPKDADGRA